MDNTTPMDAVRPPPLSASLQPMEMVFMRTLLGSWGVGVFMGMILTGMIHGEQINSHINCTSSLHHVIIHASETQLQYKEPMEENTDGHSLTTIRTNDKSKAPTYIDLMKSNVDNPTYGYLSPNGNDVSVSYDSLYSNELLLKRTKTTNKIENKHKLSVNDISMEVFPKYYMTNPTPAMGVGSKVKYSPETLYMKPKTLLRLDGAISSSPFPTKNKFIPENAPILACLDSFENEKHPPIYDNLNTEEVEELVAEFLNDYGLRYERSGDCGDCERFPDGCPVGPFNTFPWQVEFLWPHSESLASRELDFGIFNVDDKISTTMSDSSDKEKTHERTSEKGVMDNEVIVRNMKENYENMTGRSLWPYNATNGLPTREELENVICNVDDHLSTTQSNSSDKVKTHERKSEEGVMDNEVIVRNMKENYENMTGRSFWPNNDTNSLPTRKELENVICNVDDHLSTTENDSSDKEEKYMSKIEEGIMDNKLIVRNTTDEKMMEIQENKEQMNVELVRKESIGEEAERENEKEDNIIEKIEKRSMESSGSVANNKSYNLVFIALFLFPLFL